MSKPKFTPGPWKVSGVEGCRMIAINRECPPPTVVADVWGKGECHESNAALIAAAPEMYEFINWLRSIEGQCAIIKGKKYLPVIFDKVDELLKKARGEE